MRKLWIIIILLLTTVGMLRAGDITLSINADKQIGIMYNFWSTSVCTSQDFFTEEGLPPRLKRKYPFTEYFNCVRMLGGRADKKNMWFKGVGPNGEALCDFSPLLGYLRGMVRGGYTPRLVLDNVPTAMSEPEELHTYGNTMPPRDFKIWHSYITQLVKALVAEFGRETVNGWRFRVGTEPDLLPGHWSGTEEEYYQHYDWSVDAVTSILPDADIGPGNILDPHEKPWTKKKNRWGLNLIDHCATETNRKTGAVGSRMTFFGISAYSHVGQSIDPLDVAVKKVKECLARYPQYALLPIEIQEFSVLTDEHKRRLWGEEASVWAASWMAAVSEKIYRNNVAQVYQWGTTTDGVFNPRTHVFALLSRMQGGARLHVNGAVMEADAKVGCLAGERDNGYDLLIYRHEPQREDGSPVSATVRLTGKPFPGGQWKIVEGYVIDKNHSAWYPALIEDLQAAGIPHREGFAEFTSGINKSYGAEGVSLFNRNREKYEKLAELADLASLPDITKHTAGSSEFKVSLAGHSVIYLRIQQD
jgi:xylan 1,4-beta-xylosidase